MKIKVLFNKNKRVLQVPAIFQTPHKRIVSDFVIDTGSPWTILNYSDSIRLGIPHDNKSEIIRIGSKTYQSYVFNKFNIVFLCTKGNVAITGKLTPQLTC